MNATNDSNRGPWQQTATGLKFHPLDPRPEEVVIEDIAHALAMQCRFGGHCMRHYSVAEHCLYVGWRVGLLAWPRNAERELFALRELPLAVVKQLARLMLAGVLHDASEAYVVDVPRPVKVALNGYAEIEARVMRAITERFGLEAGAFELPIVKRADEELLTTEARDLMTTPPEPWTFRDEVMPSINAIPRKAPDVNEVMRIYVETVEGLCRVLDASTAIAPVAYQIIENIGNEMSASGYGELRWFRRLDPDEWRVQLEAAPEGT